MVQWKSGCDYYLLSYEPFLSPKFVLQNGLEKVHFTATIGIPLRKNGDCDVQKVTWNEGPDQALQGKQLSSRNDAAYAT